MGRNRKSALKDAAIELRWKKRYSRDRTFVVLVDRRTGYRRNFPRMQDANAWIERNDPRIGDL